MLDDDDLLWNTTPGGESKLAVQRAVVPGAQALVHSIYGHLGVAPTLLLVKGKYKGPTAGQDVRVYVRSCGCKRRKRAWSQRVAMIPARFPLAWRCSRWTCRT